MSEQQATKAPGQAVEQLQQQSVSEPVGQMVDTFDKQYKTIGIGAVAGACSARHKASQRQF